MGIMQSLVETLPLFHEVFDKEIAITLNDIETRSVVFVLDGSKVKLHLKQGTIIDDSPELRNVFQGRIVKCDVPVEMFGSPMNSEIYPVRENGKVVGALSFIFPVEAQQKVEEYMQSLQTIINDLQLKVTAVAAHSEELSATSETMTDRSRQALENSQRSNEVTDFIKTISKQTNLLGLNASIEAARAGQFGAGFNIVAQEVRKLSSETSTATEQIETSLKTITGNVQALMDSMEQIQLASNEQAQLVQEFSQLIGNLSDVSGQMAYFMKEVLR
ncbi:methyl-accepting chemotaxis protein [Lysinibacillus sp. NPDC096418]|uniref:methyl-accepting chemotaxis protein n=1 Tax=Lysinibacillus sp. NPDC096418 TaxID=3364138 RepID=UPI0037F318F7